ncbi:MAG: SCO family protein, partial [Bacteroidetes bacterium]|nr:SCO family protein [Bacteroidota bacterium]
PEHDRPSVLKAYAERLGADLEHWNFVWGSQDNLYDQARYGYFMTALESDTAAGGFFHSDNFVLIDQNMHIRGYYDGTSTKDVDQLLIDIEYLVKQIPNEQ